MHTYILNIRLRDAQPWMLTKDNLEIFKEIDTNDIT